MLLSLLLLEIGTKENVLSERNEGEVIDSEEGGMRGEIESQSLGLVSDGIKDRCSLLS